MPLVWQLYPALLANWSSMSEGADGVPVRKLLRAWVAQYLRSIELLLAIIFSLYEC